MYDERDVRFESHRKSGIAYHKRGFEMCFRTAILSHLGDSFYKRAAWIAAYSPCKTKETIYGIHRSRSMEQ